MNILKRLLNWERPAGRLDYGVVAVPLVYLLMDMGCESIRGIHATLQYVVEFALALALAGLWIRAITGRMVDLRVSRWCALPFVLVLLGVALVPLSGRPPAVVLLAIVFLVLQVPLMILPSRWAERSRSPR